MNLYRSQYILISPEYLLYYPCLAHANFTLGEVLLLVNKKSKSLQHTMAHFSDLSITTFKLYPAALLPR